MKTAERVAYRHMYARILLAMSMADALQTLGFPPGATPTPEEVKRAQRRQTIQHHPDRGGDPKKQVEINVAADILLGKERPRRPGYEPGAYETGRGPYTGPEPPSWYQPEGRPKERDEEVSFEEAKSQGGIPGGVEWLFVTDNHRSGYSSDESTNTAHGWVAVGQTDNAWVFTAAENLYRADYYPGSLSGKKDIWRISTHTAPKGETTARFFYGNVMKAWKRFQHLKKRFNSKVIPAEGWTFSDRLPSGNKVSIKNFLLNTGMMGEGDLTAPRKYEIKVKYEAAPFGQRKNPPAGFYSPGEYYDPYKLTFIINGREFELPVQTVERLAKLRVKGKRFNDWMFGDRVYGGAVKVLTRKREGKEVMGWMAENLPGLPEWVETAFKAASTAQPSPRRRRRW